MFYSKRYLLNINTGEVHDTKNIKDECSIPSIKEEHKKWFDYLSEALSYPHNDNQIHNDGCAHCLPQYHTR